MDITNRRELARWALDGYVSGPTAPIRATARALAKLDNAVAAVLVEGISDQIALETAAAGCGRDLEAERVVIVPIGGAHAIGRFLTRLGPLGTGVRLAGLCDLREEERAAVERDAARRRQEGGALPAILGVGLERRAGKERRPLPKAWAGTHPVSLRSCRPCCTWPAGRRNP